MRIIMITTLVSISIYTRISLGAEWKENHLFNINWGTGDMELMISPPLIEDKGTPNDSTDDNVIPGSGPTNAIVDKNGNLIFASYDFKQLKGFDNKGNLIFDYSYGEAQYKPEMYTGNILDIAVDSLSYIYLTSFPGMDHVPVLNYSGEIVDSLYPFKSDSLLDLSAIYINPNGEMVILDMDLGFISYKNGTFQSGGSGGMIATNGSYYSVTVLDSITLRFNKYEDPDSSGRASTRQYSIINSPGSNLKSAYIIRGGNGDSLYVDVRMRDYITYELWKFDLFYNLIDRLQLAPINNRYQRRIPPFVANEGTIYEFRCLDDGLHVIKWTK